jgi:hypothetical protein
LEGTLFPSLLFVDSVGLNDTRVKVILRAFGTPQTEEEQASASERLSEKEEES